MGRNLFTGGAAVSGSIAAATALQQDTSNAVTQTDSTVTGGQQINLERLKRFKEEVHEKAEATVNNSPLFKMFDEYGFPERVLKVQIVFMLDEMKSTNRLKQLKDNELIDLFSQMSGEELVIQSCCGCYGLSCRC